MCQCPAISDKCESWTLNLLILSAWKLACRAVCVQSACNVHSWNDVCSCQVVWKKYLSLPSFPARGLNWGSESGQIPRRDRIKPHIENCWIFRRFRRSTWAPLPWCRRIAGVWAARAGAAWPKPPPRIHQTLAHCPCGHPALLRSSVILDSVWSRTFCDRPRYRMVIWRSSSTRRFTS